MRCWCGVILRHWRTNPRRAPTPNECGVSFGSDPDFLGRSRCGFARWHNPEHEGRNLFPGFERFGNLVADRVLTGFKLWRKAAIAMASSAVMSQERPRHNRRQDAAVPPFTNLYRLHDLLWVQLPMPVFLSGVMIGPTKTPDPESRSPHPSRRESVTCGSPEEVSRRMAVVAAAERDEIFAARDL
jgi:hypothetical protein